MTWWQIVLSWVAATGIGFMVGVFVGLWLPEHWDRQHRARMQRLPR